jgi:hypothetical protein
MRTLFLVVLLALSGAATRVQAQVSEDKRPKPVAYKPDLTITQITWRNKPRSALITVANVGAGAAGESFGGYGCQGEPNEKGMSFGFGGQFVVPALAPGQKFKVLLDCGDKTRITGASVDSGKKIDESNESNNGMSFAEVQTKNGPVKKPRSDQGRSQSLCVFRRQDPELSKS